MSPVLPDDGPVPAAASTSVNLRRRALIFLGGSVLASGAAMARVPSRKIADRNPVGKLEELVPSQFEGWAIDRSIPVVLPAPDVQAKLDAIYNQVVSRTYINRQGERIMLSVAYGGDQSDGLRAHRPEVCYSAQGFTTRDLQDGQLELPGRSIPVRRLVATQGARIEPITYWMTIGTQVARTGLETKLAQLRYSTRGLIPDGLLMRVSNISRDAAPSYRLHDAFMNALVTAMPAQDRWRFVGGEPGSAA
jgi:EpsI family protein